MHLANKYAERPARLARNLFVVALSLIVLFIVGTVVLQQIR